MTAPPDPDETDEPLTRVHAATELMDHHRAEIGRLATIRATALLDLHAQAGNARETARLLGVTREHTYRLLREAATRVAANRPG